MSQTAFFILALALFPAFACFALFLSLVAYSRGERGRLQNRRRIRTLELVIEHLFAEIDDIITLLGRLGAAAESTQRPEANDSEQPIPPPSAEHDIRPNYGDVEHRVSGNPSVNLRSRGANRTPADTHNSNYTRALARLDGLPTTSPQSFQSPSRTTLRTQIQPRGYRRRPPTPLTNGSTPLTNSTFTRIRPREGIANGYLLASSGNNVRRRENNNIPHSHPTNDHTSPRIQPSALTPAQHFRLIDDLGEIYMYEQYVRQTLTSHSP